MRSKHKGNPLDVCPLNFTFALILQVFSIMILVGRVGELFSEGNIKVVQFYFSSFQFLQ
jgi:hypothetical protein